MGVGEGLTKELLEIHLLRGRGIGASGSLSSGLQRSQESWACLLASLLNGQVSSSPRLPVSHMGLGPSSPNPSHPCLSPGVALIPQGSVATLKAGSQHDVGLIPAAFFKSCV